MKQNFLLFLFVFCGTLLLPAQTVISGWVNDKSDKKPIGGVAVTLHDAEGETVTYAITKQDGSFSLNVKSDIPQFTLQARLLGYKEVKKSIENKTQQLFIEMSFGEIELREVVVKSRPIWNREDTLVYSVDAFKSEGDRSIGDLLKKLPGVEVSESGGIKYQGESINKFYIEGLDLLENRYGIATNNVPVEAVQNVEVIENHQPVKALTDVVASSNAAINLRLKKDKMERPGGTATLGAGYADTLLWLTEIFALSAGRKQQFIAMYKGNNAAKDISAELTQQSLSVDNLQDFSNFQLRSLFSTDAFSYPPLEKKRYLFNQSHTVSINNLWKTGEESQLRLNVQYLHDALNENVTHKSEYMLPDGALRIEETSSLTRQVNRIDASLTYTNNNTGYYLNSALSWKGNWDKVQSSVMMNRPGVSEHFHLPAQLIQNDLKYVKKWGGRIWDISSFSVYSSQPQWLKVSVDTLNTHQQQTVNLSGFYTRNSSYYSLGWKNSSFILKGAVEGWLDKYSSDLSHPVFTDSERSRLSSDYFLLELIPSYMYRVEKITLMADIALSSHHLDITNRLSESKHNKRNLFYANPSVKVNYRISPMLSLNAGWRYTNSIGGFLDLTNVYYMSAYRNFNKRSDILRQNWRQSFNASLRYRNPLTTFFFNTSVAYSPAGGNTIASQHFVGTELVRGAIAHDTRSQMWLWTGYVGKYFSELRTNMSINVSYNSLSSHRQQQGAFFPLRASGWSFMPKINVKISDASSVSYQAIASNRKTTVKRHEKNIGSSLWQVSQQLSAFYLLGKQWQFNGRLEHSFNEIGEANSINMFFADFGIMYKNQLWEFNLSANNLFNETAYSYSNYVGLDKYDYTYQLRPRILMVTMSRRF